MSRLHTDYKVTVGLGETIYVEKVISVLNGSLQMLGAVKTRMQRKYGALAWVKFVRLVK